MWGLFCNVQSNTFEYNKVQLNTFECINQQPRCCSCFTFALSLRSALPAVADGRRPRHPAQYLARQKGGIPIGVRETLRRLMADIATTRRRLSITPWEVLGGK